MSGLRLCKMKRIGKRILIAGVVWLAFGQVPFIRSEALSISQSANNTQSGLIAFVGDAVSLGSDPIHVTFQPAAEAGADQRTLAVRFNTLASGRHIYLVVRDLRVVGQPGVLFRLYLDLPPEGKPVRTDSYFVGALNFYNAAEPGRFDAPNDKSPMFISYDITRVLKNLQAQKLLSDQTTLTIIPTGPPATHSNPRIGRLEIIEQ
jgi:hypothetical protein